MLCRAILMKQRSSVRPLTERICLNSSMLSHYRPLALQQLPPQLIQQVIVLLFLNLGILQEQLFLKVKTPSSTEGTQTSAKLHRARAQILQITNSRAESKFAASLIPWMMVCKSRICSLESQRSLPSKSRVFAVLFSRK